MVKLFKNGPFWRQTSVRMNEPKFDLSKYSSITGDRNRAAAHLARTDEGLEISRKIEFKIASMPFSTSNEITGFQ